MTQSDEISVLKNTITELTQRIKKMEDTSKTKSFIYLKDGKAKRTVTIDIIETSYLNITPVKLVFNNIYNEEYSKIIDYKSAFCKYRDLSDYLKYIKYLTNLKFIAIHGVTLIIPYEKGITLHYDVGIKNLSFLEKNTEILSIRLNNLSMLEDINQIVTLPNLQKITIDNCPNIKNLKILEQCISLKKLIVKPPINLNGILLPSVEVIII